MKDKKYNLTELTTEEQQIMFNDKERNLLNKITDKLGKYFPSYVLVVQGNKEIDEEGNYSNWTFWKQCSCHGKDKNCQQASCLELLKTAKEDIKEGNKKNS